MFSPFKFAFKIFKFLFYICLALFVFISIFFISLPNVSYLRDHNPKKTSFMKMYLKNIKTKGEDPVLDFKWVPYSNISQNLKRAVLIAEDDAFFNHKGFDWFQLKESFKRNWRDKSLTRGGSTITQQLVKNLYLKPGKNPLRKLREWIITFQIERTLSKKRIFEIYLNVVEWGPGVFGAHSAAKYYFGKSASHLSVSESAYLAAIIPNPNYLTKPSQSRKTAWKKNWIIKKMMKKWGN